MLDVGEDRARMWFGLESLKAGDTGQLSSIERAWVWPGGVKNAGWQPRLRGSQLSQLGVFCFGFLQDGNIRVSIFPQREKILVRGARFAVISLQGVSTAHLQMRQRPVNSIAHDAAMLEDLLE